MRTTSTRHRPPRIGRRAAIGTAALGLAMLAATACSAPTPAGAPPATPAGGSATAAAPDDPAALCGAAVDVATVIGAGPDLGDGTDPQQPAAGFAEYRAALEPPLSALEQSPPQGLRDDLGTLARQARFAIANNDPNAVQTDEFEAATARLTSYIIRDCGYPVVRVSAAEYAYGGIPPTAAQGRTVFTLVNDGKEPHDLTVYRIDDDATQPMRDIVALPEVQRDEVLDELASVSTNPGSDATEFVTLTPGRYGVACFEPRGSTVELEGTGPPHATAGEVAEFTVS